MQNFEIMEFLESPKGVNDDPPDEILVEVLPLLFVLGDLVVEVAVVCELHDDAG